MPVSTSVCENYEECKGVNLEGNDIQWANISGEYEYDVKDWVRLCRWCHRLFDFRTLQWGKK